jgi:hypothetical protein
VINMKRKPLKLNQKQKFENERDETYRTYKSKTNMSYSEFKKWSESSCSKKASLDRRPIKRNLNLLSKPKTQWNQTDVSEARKTIAFNSRMSKGRQGKEIKDCGLSRRDISLKNWALDLRKR